MNTTTRNLAWKLNWYRQSELEGALLLGRMVRFAPDGDTASRLLKHCADEARHAQLWSECIATLGLPHVRIHRSYQSLFADHGGTPANLTEVLSFTQIFERRVHKRFTTERTQPELPEIVRSTYDIMIRDEHDHLDWVHTWLLSQPETQALMNRYLHIDEIVYRTVLPHEAALWEITGLGDELKSAAITHE
ncbi:ferritin-like domain-containing protein [Rariglobus hedericola]|uniref:Ferritin-like domain-containing protein n=1 Tax=Rariglobus hedericola TaxID=2597822 RepID=A0A556QQC8_9BACT|nr:ferritin-like domain-containing protein [Rariglobus hedericola]TSJ78850.1 ferritin-like domain-containing protein [Rariglobus hedericola]